MKRLIVLYVGLWVPLTWLPIAHAGLEETRAAAEAGDVERQFELGELYEFGFRMPKNEVPALAWYIVAADNGHPKAGKRRDLLKARLPREQVAEAEREAAKIPRRVTRPAAAPAPPPATAPVNDEVPAAKPEPAAPAAPREALDPLPAPPPATAPRAPSEPAPAGSAPKPREELLGPP